MTTTEVRGIARALRVALSTVGETIVDDRPFDGDALDRRDERFVEQVVDGMHALVTRYFSLRIDGVEHLDPSRPSFYVANHNGGISGPDIPCTLSTLWRALGPKTPLYALAHDFSMRQLPPFGRVLQRAGAVRASSENARRIFARGGHALVYPGGDLDAYRHFGRRNQVVFGHRTGFVRVAQTCGVPIVPIVAHGAHRSAVIFTEGASIARAIALKRWGRLELFPLALALPWGLAIGPWVPYLPLPFPIRLRVLPPMTIARDDDPNHARERVVAVMQRALDDMAGSER